MKKKMIIKGETVEWTFEQVLEYLTPAIHKEINQQKAVFDRPQEEREVMYQEASIQLYKCFKNYDIESGYHFSTFARRYIQKGVQYETIRNNFQKNDGGIHLSMDQNLSDESEDFSLANTLSEEFDFDSPMMARDVISESIKVMTDTEVEYLLLMLNDYTQTEIANERGTSRMAASYKTRKIKEIIKEVATKYGY